MRTVAVLAHQGGWDEILLVVGPIAVIVGLLAVVRRRVGNVGNVENVENAGNAANTTSISIAKPWTGQNATKNTELGIA